MRLYLQWSTSRAVSQTKSKGCLISSTMVGAKGEKQGRHNIVLINILLTSYLLYYTPNNVVT